MCSSDLSGDLFIAVYVRPQGDHTECDHENKIYIMCLRYYTRSAVLTFENHLLCLLTGASPEPCDFLFFNYYTIIKSRCQNVFWIIWTRSLKFQSAFSKTASALLAETLVVANVLPWGIAPQPVAERQPCYLFNTTIHFFSLAFYSVDAKGRFLTPTVCEIEPPQRLVGDR